MKDHQKPFPGASAIFKCEWCGRLIYVPHSDHFRVYGGCAKYWKHQDREYRSAVKREAE